MARQIIDLTHTLSHGVEGYPGNYRVEIEQIHNVEEGGYQVSKITFDSHLGTHLDVPRHITAGGEGLERINLEKLVGPAVLVDASDKAEGGEITVEDLGDLRDRIGSGSRVLFRTGWQRHFGTPAFFEGFPGIAPELATWLVERGVALVGLETPSVHPEMHLQVHHILIDAGVVVVEALANLDRITRQEFELVCLPLKLKDCDGSPCRAIAVEEA
jgi:kynurenine formamidase